MTNQKYEIYEIDGVKYQTTCDPYPCGTMDEPAFKDGIIDGIIRQKTD